MQLTLVQHELETAVREYVAKMGVSRSVESIVFTATRGEAGMTTEITLADQSSTPQVAQIRSAPKANVEVAADISTPAPFAPAEAAEVILPVVPEVGKRLFGDN